MPRSVGVGDLPRGRGPGHLLRLAVVSILGLIGIAACSAGPTTSAPATTVPVVSSAAVPSAALCSSAGAFRTATDDIAGLDAASVGVDGVKASLQKLQAAGRDLADAAKAEFEPAVDNLTTALGSLQTTAASLSDQTSLSAKFGALTSSISGVEQAAKPILDGARASCPANS